MIGLKVYPIAHLALSLAALALSYLVALLALSYLIASLALSYSTNASDSMDSASQYMIELKVQAGVSPRGAAQHTNASVHESTQNQG